MLPLSGLRVIDLGQYVAGPMVGMMLADSGADVVRIDPPGGPRWDSPANAYLNRGKRSVVLDLKTETAQHTARRLISRSDLVIENFKPGVLQRLGLAPEALLEADPRLVILSIPGFASSDPDRNTVAAWEGVVAAATGLYTDQSLGSHAVKSAPVFTALPQASVYGAIHGAAAVMAALLRRRVTGRGEHIEIPLEAAAISAMGYASQVVESLPACYRHVIGMPSAIVQTGTAEKRESVTAPRSVLDSWRNPLLDFYRTADGKLLYLATESHRRHLDRLLDTLEIRKCLTSCVIADPYRCIRTDNLLDQNVLSLACRQEVRRAIEAKIVERTGEYWEWYLQTVGVPAILLRTCSQYLELAITTSSAMMFRLADPVLGWTIQPGRMISFGGDVDAVPRPAPVPDADRSSVPAGVANARAAQRHADVPLPKCDPPLSKIRVLDLTTVIAGPICCRTLAEYGAEVIKIDPLTPNQDVGTTIELGIDVNRGKRSMLLNLRTAAGYDVFSALVQRADIVVINSTDQRLARLRVDDASLRAINPDIILCQVTAFGGPPGINQYREWLGYDHVVQAMTGIQTRFGSPESPVVHGIASCLDYATGYVAAFGAMAALHQRARGMARASPVSTSLTLVSHFMQTPFCLVGEALPPQHEPSGQDAVGAHALYRMYRARDGWFFLGARRKDGRRLADSLGLVFANLTAFERALEDLFASGTCSDWVARLRAGGFGAHAVESLDSLRTQHTIAANDLSSFNRQESIVFVRHRHPIGGEVISLLPTWIPTGMYPRWERIPAAPKYGKHTLEILREIGYGSEAIDELLKHQVVSESWTNETYFPQPCENARRGSAGAAQGSGGPI